MKNLPKKKILFIDDEPIKMHAYSDRLKTTFEVMSCKEAMAGLDYFKRDDVVCDLLILDVMMPTPPGVAEWETNSSQETGLWLLRQIASKLNSCQTKVFILTNRNNVDQVEADALNTIIRKPPELRVKQKNATSARELFDEVQLWLS